MIDRDAAARLGIQPQAVDSTLYSAFGQRQVSIIYTQQNQYHGVLEVDPQFQLDPTSLDKIYVKSNRGNQVPLGTWRSSSTTTRLFHQSPGSVSVGDVFLQSRTGRGAGPGNGTHPECSDLKWECPPTFGEVSRARLRWPASWSTMPLLFLAALIAVYIVLGMLYESLIICLPSFLRFLRPALALCWADG